MKHPTELSRAILTDPTAQEIIDWVSPVYGNSYVGLWTYQVIGMVLSRLKGYADSLRSETNPISADLLLDMWEEHYKLPINHSLTTEQRQNRLLAKILSRGPCNPHRLSAAISSALGGVEVDIEENVAKNTFLVNIRKAVDDITPAIAVLERRKPAHLIYQIRVATQMVSEEDIRLAIAMTQAEFFNVNVYSEDIEIEDTSIYLGDVSSGTAYKIYVSDGNLHMDAVNGSGANGYSFTDRSTGEVYTIYVDNGEMYMNTATGTGSTEHRITDYTTGKQYTIYIDDGHLMMENT